MAQAVIEGQVATLEERLARGAELLFDMEQRGDTGEEYERTVRSLKAEWDGAVDAQRRVTDPARLTQANVLGLVNSVSGPRAVVVCAAQ